jgi:hypothetical protein
MLNSGWQVFVANPKKTPQIESILRRNKVKMLAFLKEFHKEKDGAHTFCLDSCMGMLIRVQTSSSPTKSSFSSSRLRTFDAFLSLPTPPTHFEGGVIHKHVSALWFGLPPHLCALCLPSA